MTAPSSLKEHEIDEFVLWPVFAAALTAALAIAVGASSFSLIFIAIFVLPLFFTTVYSSVFSITYALKCQWRRAVSLGLLPLFIAGIFIFPQTVGGSLVLLGQSVRFQANLPSYELEIAKLPNNGKRLVTFSWDGFAGYATILIYDESDELSKPLHEVDDIRRDIIRECIITPYRGHYYWCNTK